jgi:hypothetical protein
MAFTEAAVSKLCHCSSDDLAINWDKCLNRDFDYVE